MKFKDLTGQKFGKLTVIKRTTNSKWNETRWICKCECGKETITTYGKLAYNHKKSCGCILKEVVSKTHSKHKLRKDRLYNIWAKMKQRCYNTNNKSYKNYGGRGIKICKEWLEEENGFINFYKWAINNGYKEHLEKFGSKNTTIDRIDVNGNYEPNNCRWATQREQSLNRRSNVFISYNGETKTISEWVEKTNLTYSSIKHRLKRGWSIERTLTTPLLK